MCNIWRIRRSLPQRIAWSIFAAILLIHDFITVVLCSIQRRVTAVEGKHASQNKQQKPHRSEAFPQLDKAETVAHATKPSMPSDFDLGSTGGSVNPVQMNGRGPHRFSAAPNAAYPGGKVPGGTAGSLMGAGATLLQLLRWSLWRFCLSYMSRAPLYSWAASTRIPRWAISICP